MRARLLLLALIALQPLSADAKKFEAGQRTLGPYRLGTPYEELKSRAGFKLDEKRTNPKEEIVAGKIIDRGVEDTPSIQRLIFKRGKLYRISIIFGNAAEWSEERVKGWMIKQGLPDPGAKEKVDQEQRYVWQFRDSFAALLPADGGRWMASLMDETNP